MSANRFDSSGWIGKALDAGFSYACALDVAALTPQEAVRVMCAANRCGMFEKCWTCPPACGTLDTCEKRLRRYSTGLLVQTVTKIEDAFDYPGMCAGESLHQATFSAFYKTVRAAFPQALALGSGGCRICSTCTFPSAPCRFPDRAIASMEAYGLLVAEICHANGLGYRYGENALSFTGCYLIV